MLDNSVSQTSPESVEGHEFDDIYNPIDYEEIAALSKTKTHPPVDNSADPLLSKPIVLNENESLFMSPTCTAKGAASLVGGMTAPLWRLPSKALWIGALALVGVTALTLVGVLVHRSRVAGGSATTVEAVASNPQSAAPSTGNRTRSPVSESCLSEKQRFMSCPRNRVSKIDSTRCYDCVANAEPTFSSCNELESFVCGALNSCPCSSDCQGELTQYLVCTSAGSLHHCPVSCKSAPYPTTSEPTLPLETSFPTAEKPSKAPHRTGGSAAPPEMHPTQAPSSERAPKTKRPGIFDRKTHSPIHDTTPSKRPAVLLPSPRPTPANTTTTKSLRPATSARPLSPYTSSLRPTTLPSHRPISSVVTSIPSPPPTLPPLPRTVPPTLPTTTPTNPPTESCSVAFLNCGRLQREAELCLDEEIIDRGACESCAMLAIPPSFQREYSYCTQLDDVLCPALRACPCGSCTKSLLKFVMCGLQETSGCVFQCV